MSKISTKPPVWKRPKTKVYDYNYNLGEHYYNPQLRHMESKYANRAASPPKAKTFAERFAENPVYGNNSPLEYRSSVIDSPLQGPRRASMQDELASGLGIGSRRQPLFESGRGLTPDLDEIRPRITSSRPRLDFGERLLDAVGGYSSSSRSALAESSSMTQRSAAVLQDDPFDDAFFNRRKLAPPRSAGADFGSEDPFRKRFDALALTSASSDDDLLLNDFKKDSESVVSGFRSRMAARRQRDEEANASEADSSAFESRVDKIRSRAKARLADLSVEDDYDIPKLSLRTSDSASRARALLRDLERDDLDSSLQSSVGTTKTVRITKRTIKTTIDAD